VREIHHVVARGLGGGRRLDILANILSVGSTQGFECHCHSRIDTASGKNRCLMLIAQREGCSVDDVETVTRFILALDKDASKERIESEIAELPFNVGKMVESALKSGGKL